MLVPVKTQSMHLAAMHCLHLHQLVDAGSPIKREVFRRAGHLPRLHEGVPASMRQAAVLLSEHCSRSARESVTCQRIDKQSYSPSRLGAATLCCSELAGAGAKHRGDAPE